MRTILIVDDLAIFREPIDAVLRGHGYRTLTASNGREAITITASERPDLVILDMGMPGLDGVDVLRYMRADSDLQSIPVFMVSAESDRARVVEAVKLGIMGYMLKSQFSLTTLLDRIDEHFAAAPASDPGTQGAIATPISSGTDSVSLPLQAPPKAAPQAAPAPRSSPVTEQPSPRARAGEAGAPPPSKPILNRAAVLKQLESVGELKGFSPTVSQVLSLTANPRCSLEDVARAVGQDQGIALKILKLANSPAYTRGDRVDTVQKAILRIGMEQIRQAVLNIGVVERFSSLAFEEHLSVPLFWEHSIATGIISAELAHAMGSKDFSLAFTAGLLHDLGRYIFAEQLPGPYAQVLAHAAAARVPLEDAEKQMFQLTHAEAMNQVLAAWRFPAVLLAPIVFHHVPLSRIQIACPRQWKEVVRLIVANRMAHAMMLGSSGNETIYPVDAHCRLLKIDGAVLRRIEETVPHQTRDTKLGLLSQTNAPGWARRVDQVRSTLREPFRPLFISSDDGLDAYRIFLMGIAESAGTDPPNIAVVHIVAAKEKLGVLEKLAAAEGELRVSGLPLLLLSPDGRVILEEAEVGPRWQQAVPTPTPVSRLIEAINSGLESGIGHVAV